MQNFQFLIQESSWYIFLCLGIALGYSILLYKLKTPWDKKTNYLLASLRFILVFTISFLLLGPLFKYFKNYFEKPTIVVAVDNSQSVHYSEDTLKLKEFKNNLKSLVQNLQKEDLKVDIQLLDNSTITPEQLDNVTFSAPYTNISQTLNEISSTYANKNLTGVILASDGIFNQGMDPNHTQVNFPIYSVGLGDTIPKLDLNLKTVLYNKIAYTNSRFPIVAEVHNTGFAGKTVNIFLKQNGKILEKKSFPIKSNKGISEVEFQGTTDQKGLQHFVLEVELQQGEFTPKNNFAHAYIEVIEGKEKILLVAPTPHPDIKAIKSSIEKKENFEVQVYIPGFSELKIEKYDLVIFHQLPDWQNQYKSLMDKLVKEETSVLYILGSQTNISAFNSINNSLKISGRQGQMDNVTPSINPAFDKFRIEKEEADVINNYPPASVPFGNYGFGEELSNIVLFQRIGTLTTQKPLLILSQKSNKKVGILCSEGIWQWKLDEYNETKSTKVFDKLINSIVQYLSSKEDKRKFRVYPISNEYLISDPVSFETEIYNDIFEKIYGLRVDLKISSEGGETTSYSYVNSETGRFDVKGLKQGVYKYTASSTISGKIEKAQGEFTIKDINIEALNTTADHELLKLLSAKTNGKFFHIAQLEGIANELKRKEVQSIIHTNEELIDVINLKWLFFVILFFISLEWFIRKYKGSY